MSRSPAVRSAVAALLMLFALSGCGKDGPEVPGSATPATAGGASGGASGVTSATPPTSESGAKAGPTSASSKRFAARLDKICRAHDSSEAEVYYADALRSGEDPTSDLDEMVASYRRLARAAGALDPPASAEVDFNAYTAALRSLVKQSGPLRAALVSGDTDQAVKLDRAFSATLVKRSEAAVKLGAGNCIMDSAD